MEKTIQFQGADIHYKIKGKGNAVILLHGFGEDSTIWNSLEKYLEEKYLLIIPDIPGSGKSEIISRANVCMNDYADCIKSIIDAEQQTSVVMIGHSMGGYITLAFAEKYPGYLKSIGLFHSSAYSDDKEKIETRKKGIDFIRENGSFSFLKTSIPALFKEPEKNREYIEVLLKKGKGFSNEALIQYYEAMIARPDRSLIFTQLNLPYLFIMGEHDKAVPFKQSLKQSQLPEHSYVYILRNSAHMGMLEEMNKSNKIIADFLKDLYQ